MESHVSETANVGHPFTSTFRLTGGCWRGRICRLRGKPTARRRSCLSSFLSASFCFLSCQHFSFSITEPYTDGATIVLP